MNTWLFEQVVSQLAEVFRRLSGNPESFHHSDQLEECRLYCPVTRTPQKPVRRIPGHPFQR
ncbi:hypothetical protein ACTL6P_07720 [Endozoicomonas acroporae]|uniref:hypothetical protein n=1 Tax=Endozoicomonas acroporae TaxID=1701104 RepID=UPI0011AED1EC|nr:hypothetical protein [Endozoicomonas acroporae]